MVVSVITGVAGQDGSYLAELLLDKGHVVVGIARRISSSNNYKNISQIANHPNFKLLQGDITDYSFLYNSIRDNSPDFWYNLAAQSNVGHSFKEPIGSFEVNSKSVMMQLKIISEISPHTRFYQASTTEILGGHKCPDLGYSEKSQFYPVSPYAISKLTAHWCVRNYREVSGMFACNGITGNHSSPRRGIDFAIRKITSGVAKVRLGVEKNIKMGDLSSFRDIGHSKDYVKAMYLVMSQKSPDDYVISTGVGAPIKDIFKYTCSLAGLNFEDVYRMDKRYLRPSDVPKLLGNPEKIIAKTGWAPTYDWKKLVEEMYISDINLLKNEHKKKF